MNATSEKINSNNNVTHFFAGCDHNVLHEIVAEAIEELGDKSKAICVSPVGCANYAYNYTNIDFCQSAGNHAAAVSTGIKKVRPEHIVFTYQDNNQITLDTGEIIHAANRGENITVIFNNNGTYDLNAKNDDVTARKPIKLSEIIAALESSVYVARIAINDDANETTAKNAIKHAFKLQKAKKGFTFLEVVGKCNSNAECDNIFPLGVFKDKFANIA